MPLPTVFAALTTPVMSQLDGNFNAVAFLGTLPCSCVGTNALTLTPLVAAPQPTIVLQPQLRVSAIAANNNTGATTANVSGLGVLTVYKDAPTGPTALAGGEIVANN